MLPPQIGGRSGGISGLMAKGTDIVPASPPVGGPPALPTPAAADLVDAFLGRMAPNSRRAYDSDLRRFAEFLAEGELRRGRRRPAVKPARALDYLIQAGPGRANWLMLRYREHMIGQGLSPATRNRRISAIRSAMKLGRQLGLMTWTLEIPSEKAMPYRDTRGPGEPAYRAMVDAAAPRDRAILRLLHDLGLRRGEVVDLDLEHLDFRHSRVSVRGKGREEREWLTLPFETLETLKHWLIMRGLVPGPLFTSQSRAYPGRRLTGGGLWYIVAKCGKRAGLGRVRPHGLRHTAISHGLDLTKGDVRRVQKFSRHRNVQTVLIYDDARRDDAGEIASMVAADPNATDSDTDSHG